MYLEPQLAAVAAEWVISDLSDVATARVVDAAMVATVTADQVPGLSPQAVRTDEISLRSSHGSREFGIRVYTPRSPRADRGALVFAHGGAFCLGDLETDHLRCTLYAQQANTVVISVDYALAPEHPYPGGLHDVLDAVAWTRGHATALGAAPGVVGVAGESAGAGLAAAACLALRDSGTAPVCQMLLFPALDYRLGTASMTAGVTTPAWNAEQSRLMWDLYLGGSGGPAPALASPAVAPSLEALPVALIQTAEHDPLRDEGLEYAARLQQAGVSTELHHYPGTFHVFDFAVPTAGVSQRAIGEQVRFLRRNLRARAT